MVGTTTLGQFPAAAAATGAEKFYTLQDGVEVAMTAAQIAAFAGGAPGVGVSDAVSTYQQTTTNVQPTTWLSTMPTPIAGQYMWTRTITTYTDSTTSTVYSVAYQGTNGTGLPAPGAATSAQILSWATSQAFQFSGAVPTVAAGTAAITWPDGTAGVFTADTINATWGAIDAWHATYVGTSSTTTATQTAVTRDAYGNVTTQPAITVA